MADLTTEQLDLLANLTDGDITEPSGGRGPAVIRLVRDAVAEIRRSRSDLQAAHRHLHWLVRGGEFAAWMESTNPEMPLAAVREIDDAEAFLDELDNAERLRKATVLAVPAPCPARTRGE